jgi:hypothetical protein
VRTLLRDTVWRLADTDSGCKEDLVKVPFKELAVGPVDAPLGDPDRLAGALVKLLAVSKSARSRRLTRSRCLGSTAR